MRRAMILAACVVVLAGISSANGAYRITGEVGRYNGSAGVEFYELFLSVRDPSFPLGNDSVTLSIESPTGTVFEELVPISDNAVASITSIAPGNVDAMVSGVWTIREQLGAELNVYQFTMPAIASNSLWGTPPEILSPADGAVVAQTFIVEVNDPEVSGMRSALQPSDAPTIPPKLSPWTGGNGFVVSFEDIPNFQGAVYESLRVSNRTPLPFSVTRVSPTGSASFTNSFDLRDYSASISLTVVPEPRSVVLAIMVGVGLVAARRARFRTN